MKKLIFIFLVFTIGTTAIPGKIVPMPGLVNPNTLTIDGDHIYITDPDLTAVYIFASSDFKLICKFGQAGDGPGEFRSESELKLFPSTDSLVINSVSKVSLFSEEGKFIREFRTPTPGLVFQPLGKVFAVSGKEMENREEVLTYSLYNEKFEKGKDVFKIKNPFQATKLLRGFNPLSPERIKCICTKDKIFINEFNGLIHVFDADGKMLFDIRHPYTELKVSETLKEQVYDYYKNYPGLKAMFESLKPLMNFPETFPPVRDFCFADDKVYVLPFAKENGMHTFYIFDLTGKFTGKVQANLQEVNIMKLYPYAIANNQLYQLVPDEDEEFQLHITPMK